MNEGLENDFYTLYDLEELRLKTEEELHEEDYFNNNDLNN